MGCCKSCDEGGACDGDAAAAFPAVLQPGPEPADLVGADDPRATDSLGGVQFLLEPGVPQKVAWRLGLVWAALGGGVQDVSQAYELGECGRVRVSFSVLALTGAGNARLEGSLDKACWETIASTSVTFNTLGYFRIDAPRNLNYRFVRVRYGHILSPFRLVLSATIVGTPPTA